MALSNRLIRAAMQKERRRRWSLKVRKNSAIRHGKLRQAGYTTVQFWIDKALYTQAKERARALGHDTNVLLQAAAELGLRTLRPSELGQYERRWRSVVRLPLCPRYPTSRFDNGLRTPVAVRMAIARQRNEERRKRYGVAHVKRIRSRG